MYSQGKMFKKTNLRIVNHNLLLFVRNLTSTEISTALRPFYFTVHPDLFGQHPKEREVNETSLQQLSSVLETLQSSKYSRPAPVTLSFYVKNRENQHDAIKLIKIYLKEKDLGSTIIHILKSCDLPTSHLQHYVKSKSEEMSDKAQDKNPFASMKYKNEYDFTGMDENHPLYHTFGMREKMQEAKVDLRLHRWLQNNFEAALKKCKSGFASREEIKRLKEEMIIHSGLKDIRWDCGWNGTHFRGCLLSLKSLMEQHPQHMKNLKDHILIFSYFTGVSLEGHIMLFSGEVRHNWLDFIKNLKKHEAALGRFPFYEKGLSHVLRNIKVGRRKFMPEVKVGEYELDLKQLTTSISDYLGCNSYPKSWPESLEDYEIVVESEAGPLMVSPTGQFIVPSAIPGRLLVSFITANLEDASRKAVDYKHDKVMERTLHDRCVDELQLAMLLKDDNIYPEIMIKCCERLLENKDSLKYFTKDLHLNVSTYYSVLSDGVVCIPWNFNL